MTPVQPDTAAVCLDVGSTWTKAVLVRADGGLAGFAEHPTTTGDVLAGMDATVRAVSAAGGSAAEPELLACSSAGGGLRLAVVGSDMLSSTEAGHRVACSAGAHVVHVHAGPLEPADVRALRDARPGVVLLLGGSDGDDPAPLLHNAGRLARARIRPPILLAGNSEGRAEALATLLATGRAVVTSENVLPRLGEVVPEPARAALAELYQRHAIGGRGATVAPRFRRLVRVVTPDAVGRGAAELARIRGSKVLLVDVGCATTDVHSVDGTGAVRTVEGDLGVRAAAASVLVEGQAEGVVDPVEADLLAPTVARMASEVAFVPSDAGSAAEDRRIAALASVVAVRRHLRTRADAADGLGLVVLTGGVFRQRASGNGLGSVIATLCADPVLAAALGDVEVVVDADFTVAPAGLLATHGRTDAAEALLRDHLLG
ncbi:glutamate mutase L [Pseudonocardia sp. KRD-184]|uniref:Glutamate mutase L n=1 Tax=Pseudonocardia oceani TaxID=2792013 RepID=A0ABS6U6E5_9PSEU|nr:glutamate mutase L [Pseudonocardia oceani]MBW0090614.1 glutamate mutase L [Pseudonocardia oceani]MBW0096820.1 glutamate mutase L [Pseudonocardia oceani]MBW0113290.1 glutamate mutase L [Pseudonocardia oceani]MBW0122870.1 glutamate mutase L [Pseudonocardia oceani]MBW0127775.1 glutamate mutase L [Pseudonocardia oceani]